MSDTRDDPWTGRSGRMYKLTNVSTSSCALTTCAHTTQEYAGLPGSSTHSHFFKTIFQSQLSRALYPGSSIVSETARKIHLRLDELSSSDILYIIHYHVHHPALPLLLLAWRRSPRQTPITRPRVSRRTQFDARVESRRNRSARRR